jgi:hypothetical protein
MRSFCVWSLIAVACQHSSSSAGPDAGVALDVPANSRALDVLIVVDTSSSMSDKANALTNNLAKIGDLLTSPAAPLDLHVGVISADLGISPFMDNLSHCVASGDAGELRSTPQLVGCLPPTANTESPNGTFIEDVASGSTRLANYTGSLGETLACIGTLQANGCAFQQPLEAAKRALDGTSAPMNAGFLRPQAALLLIFVGDGDDCSAHDTKVFDTNISFDNATSALGFFTTFRCAEFGVKCDGSDLTRQAMTYGTCAPRGDSYLYDPQYYVDFLRSLKSDPADVYVVTVDGPPSPFSVSVDSSQRPQVDPSCTNGIAAAQPAVRLEALASAFGAHGTASTICQDDFSGAASVADAIGAAAGAMCLDGAVDVTDLDPTDIGLQIGCTLADVAGSQRTVIPACPMVDDRTPAASPRPCWWASIDLALCRPNLFPSGVDVHVEGTLPDPSRIVVTCP